MKVLIFLLLSFDVLLANPNLTDKQTENSQKQTVAIQRSNSFWHYLISSRSPDKVNQQDDLSAYSTTAQGDARWLGIGATAVNSTLWGGYSNDFSSIQSSGDFTAIPMYAINGITYLGNQGVVRTFLGLGSAAYQDDALNLKVSATSNHPSNGNFAIGNSGGRNFIQSHANQPLDINPLGNPVYINGNLIGSAAYLNSDHIVKGTNAAGVNYASDANNIVRAGFYSGFNGGNVPPGDFGFISVPTFAGIHAGEKYNLQIGANIGQSSNLLFRTTDATGAGTWTNVWTAKNFNPNNYFPVAGGRVNGSVGISVNTLDPEAKLTVGGKIHSQEVKVTVSAGADFVFQKDYKLKPLSEVAEYIKVNKHLPEIASAEEMEKNGLELGEMNVKLLQKSEELTLHLIEQNKRIESQEKTNSELLKRVNQLEQK